MLSILVRWGLRLLALLITGAMLRTRLASGGAAVALAAAAVGYGILQPEPTATGRIHVAGVQPGIVYGPQRRLETQLRLTHELAGLDHNVIVWGQSSARLDPAEFR
ncbi:apolipoprotein N-acyltransferase [Streptosporangium subroseum]|uniref:Apolipoprotein N-acyltransferase n=1 Tax=Streptosporangium subroseum TaxID=106412 RepID=A0A239NZZ9_9ACTN|nr:hypothetical protein [Streptosporangium subroseum]SNT60302.1 apolipoprotein N-acyltransferase [Streptosporangium subroseum]